MDANGKPLSQFKLARLQAKAEKEAAAGLQGAASGPAGPAASSTGEAGTTVLPKAPAEPVEPVQISAAPHAGFGAASSSGDTGSDNIPGKSSHTQQAAQRQRLAHTPKISEQDFARRSSKQLSSGQRGQQGEETVEQKVERYSKFLDDTLRVKLAQVLEQREEVVREIESYEKLRGTVEVMRESKTGKAKSMVNIGCELYMQASIPDTSRIMVNVGLGFFVELTLAEAAEFIQERCEQLQARADKLSEEASEVNSQIEVVLRGLQELMQISDPSTPPQRTFL